MANRVKLGDWSGTVLKHWRKLTQATVLVLTVVGTFLFTPPADVIAGEANHLVNLARFVIAVLLGLLFVPANYLGKPSHAPGWAVASAAAMVTSLWLYFSYVDAINQLTVVGGNCQFREPRVIGTATGLTAKVKRKLADDPQAPSDPMNLLLMNHCEPSEVWEKPSIDHNRILLVRAYIFTAIAFALCLGFMTQAVCCLEPPTKRPTRSHPKPESGNDS